MDVCEACGERNPAGSAFCVYCGVYLGWDQRGEEDKPAATATPQAQPQTAGAAPAAAAQDAGVRQQATTAAQPRVDQAVPTTTIPSMPAGHAPCPACGNTNPSTRRFCGRCGHPLRPGSDATATVPQRQQPKSWWQRFRDPVDRKARRDYRSSLPLLYRWRRVLILLVTLIALAGLLYALGRDPVGWTKARWYDLRGTLVVVDGATYVETPARTTAEGYSARALGTPESDDAWVTAWVAKAVKPVQACGGQPAAAGMVRLTMPEPVRVRRLEIVSGLPKDDSLRPFVFRPSRIFVMYGASQCTVLDLKDDSAVQTLDLDTREPVTSVTVAVAAAYQARPGDQPPGVALSAVTVYSRPH